MRLEGTAANARLDCGLEEERCVCPDSFPFTVDRCEGDLDWTTFTLLHSRLSYLEVCFQAYASNQLSICLFTDIFAEAPAHIRVPRAI